MCPKHAVKFRKRKSQDEGETDEKSEEPHESPKRVKQEHLEKHPAHQEPGNHQALNPMEEGALHPENQDRVIDPQSEDVIEVKCGGAGRSRKRTYSSTQDTVEKQHNEKCRRLLGHLQPSDAAHCGPPNSHTRPADDLKITKGYMEEHIHGCETTLFQPNQSRHLVTRHHSPVKTEKIYSPETHFEAQKTGGVDFDNQITIHHSQPDILGGAQAPNSKNCDTSDIIHKDMLKPEGKKKPFEEQEKDISQDHGPDITPDMEKEIMSALAPGPQEDILSSAFKLTITRGDMQTLQESQWLNDDIINFYMNLISERSKLPGYAAIHTFNTFFYTKLKCGGYRSVKRWTRALNIFEKDIVLVPVHLEVHWSLVVIDLRKKTIAYWDSMGLKRPSVLRMIFQYLQEESKARRNIDLDPLEWRQYSMEAEEIPLQLNKSDCGVFTCKYADYISRGQPITFSQKHMPLFRKKMVWEILHKRLL
ncbi:sentrin-specific protease 2-like [Mesocricetus auratus]|uniref:Sentrin-specific protease 2-like n=1 Tax=Mesocricetus auratus TaxID=10036 RepID=A0ABM2WR39_MESAU|nr:sentrin-specific protease 2-like [Mesocricetus auratus]